PDPEKAPDDVEGDEATVLHFPHPGHHGREGPDDRHEAREDDRLPAVALVEGMGAQQVPALEEEGILAPEQERTRAVADPVPHLIPDDRRRGDGGEPGPELEMTRGAEDTRRDEERVAGQEEPDHEARLREYDHDQHEEAAPADDPLDVVELVRGVLQQV